MKFILYILLIMLFLTLFYESPVKTMIFSIIIGITIIFIKYRYKYIKNEINKEYNDSDIDEKSFNTDMISLGGGNYLWEIIGESIKGYNPSFTFKKMKSNGVKGKSYFEQLKNNYESEKEKSNTQIHNYINKSDIYHNVIIYLKYNYTYNSNSEPSGYRPSYGEDWDLRPDSSSYGTTYLLGSVFYDNQYHYFMIDYNSSGDYVYRANITTTEFKDYKEMIAYILLKDIINKNYLRAHMKFYTKQEQEMFYKVMNYK